MKKSLFHKILADVPKEILKLVQRQTQIAVKISQVLNSNKINQKGFASSLGMKESQLSKILAGNANLTLKTITKIETALGEDIININAIEKEEKKTTSKYLQSEFQGVIVIYSSDQEQNFTELSQNESHHFVKMKVSLDEPFSTQNMN